VVDVAAARARAIMVTNVPTYGTQSVAQMVFALLFALCRHVEAHSHAVRQGDWSRAPDFCFWKTPLIELTNKTMGIVGFGRIGRATARIADACGMRVLAADVHQHEPPPLQDFAWAEIPTLLQEADVISLHCPLLPATEGLINRDNLARMKASAFLINTSRGPLVVDRDLADALNREQIAGAALDVLTREPPAEDNPLLAARNCIITPHIAWATFESRSRLQATAEANLRGFLDGRPANVVS